MKARNFILMLSVILIGQVMYAQSDAKHDFAGKYQSDMQFVQLIPEGTNKYIAKFTKDCELTTKVGTVNDEGVLEIPFLGENQMQYMYIKKTGNEIKIWNSDNSPMMQACNGATLAGVYEKRN